MILECFLFGLLGVGLGFLTGLVPGIHVNTLCAILLGTYVGLLALGIPVHALVALVAAMATTHTIVSYIPAILLGCPEDATALSTLPGHRLLLQGRGLEAIYLTIVGGLIATLLFVATLPALAILLGHLYHAIKPCLAYILAGIAALMVLTERELRRIAWGVLVFLLAGALGLLCLGSSLVHPAHLLFPIFTGLFGVPTLLLSAKARTRLPEQSEGLGSLRWSQVLRSGLKAYFSSILLGIMPAVGAAQAAVLAQEATRKRTDEDFLLTIGGINTVVALCSIVALYAIDRPRSGAAVTIEKLVVDFGFEELLLVTATFLLACGVACMLSVRLSRLTLELVQKVDYSKLSVFIIGVLLLLTLWLTGPFGLLILFASTAIGLLPPLAKVKRSHCMGVLMVPTILFYVGLR